MEGERPILIAMQGNFCTGKTTVAESLAKKLKCPLISYDDILDTLSPSEPPSPADAYPLFLQAFDLITQVAKAQLSLGFSVIVDSPLPYRSDLEKLQSLLTESPKVSPGFVIIECNPKEVFRQIHFPGTSDKWYKPKSYLHPEQYGWYDIKYPFRSNCGPKVVVDTSDVVQVDLLAEAVYDLAAPQTNPSDGGVRIVELKEWILNHYSRPSLLLKATAQEGARSSKGFCMDGHCVDAYMEDGIQHYAFCAACAQRVEPRSPAYACRFCSLAIHESCAKFPRGRDRMSYTPENFPKFYKRVYLETFDSYCFPEEHLCPRCRLEGNEFSYDCASCIYQCHLRCGLIPTILDHETHEHSLFFWARPISGANSEYQCGACKRPGQCVAYGCMKGCDINYHPECAFSPKSQTLSFCGHQHEVKLIFSFGSHENEFKLIHYSRNREFFEFYCEVCGELMNIEAWYYNCDKCGLASHLACINFRK